jgi:glycosyltransferase involved in cell wall biosynthesis
VTPDPPNHETRLRVCMLLPSFYPIVGGLETQVERLIPFLREHNVAATVVTRLLPDVPRFEVRNGIPIHRIPVLGGAGMRSLTFTARGTLHVLRHRANVDVLHAHSIMSPTTVAALAGIPTRTPRVVTLHATFEPERLLSKPLGASRLRLYSRMIDRFIAINRDIDGLLRGHGVPPERILSIPNGIDSARFRPADRAERARLRSELDLPLDRPVALFAGRLHEVKQVDVLLKAWSNVEAGHLIILGDGEERAALDHLAGELGIRERVEFRGMVPNVDDYLRAADVFVLPSRSEGLSVALLEAMAVGCVPVATSVGGAVELITSGDNGILVAPGNRDELAAALTHALGADDWRARASARATATVANRYDLRVIARDIATLYRSLATSAR